MSTAANAALMAAMAASPHSLIGGAMVGRALAGGPGQSSLSGLLVAGETALFATEGDGGSALFTSSRVIVAEQAGLMKKRLTVKAFRRDSIIAYAIDPDSLVTLTLFGGFGQVVLHFDAGFDPMHISDWLGETLAPPASTA